MLAIGMGIRNVQTTLPGLIYALLSGLNSASVGLIALAGVRLSERVITGNMTRLLVCATACIGMLYKCKFRLINESEDSFVVLPLATSGIRGVHDYLGFMDVSELLRMCCSKPCYEFESSWV